MDHKKEKFIELASLFLSDEADIEEINQLHIFLEEKEYKEWFVWLSKKWELESNLLTRTSFSKERGKQFLFEKLEEQKKLGNNKKLSLGKQKTFSISPILKYAAVISIVMVTVFTINLFNKQPKQEVAEVPAWQEKETTAGQKVKLVLSDGTSILINSVSKLRYPTNFSDSTREVYLEGEAFFKVAHNPEKPFIVHAGTIETKVLGTSFNVNAYPDDEAIAVSLVEGKVIVGKSKTEKKELKPMQQFLYEKKNQKESVQPFDRLAIIGWQHNEFVFEGVALEEVTKKLSRCYNVQFEFENKKLMDYKIRANFSNEPLWTVLEVLKRTDNIQYELISNEQKIEKVILKSK
ncbi:FecR family protein [Flammeovirgaceae bacterium SG7u.111]|nr:FecR family protein [Flammeovirgaceae bacterium SG7u.132]WPO37259.1 FecR family protein [Flammeovirgaceae bacterium SG7u.111]